MSTTRTATIVSKTFIPAAIKDSMTAAGNRKNNVQVVIFTDDSRKVRACDTRWDGGTRNTYYVYHAASEAFYGINPDEGQEMALDTGYTLVVFSHFCGKDCIPTIYLRSQDVAAFFGSAEVPAELPCEVAADWLQDKAECVKPREAKRLLKTAAALRVLAHVA